MTMEPVTSRLDTARRQLPAVVGQMAEVIVDNPGQFALIGAATVVATRAAVNIVRPRGPLEGLALLAVLQFGLPALGNVAIRKGWLKFRIRDAHGCLVPMTWDDANADCPDSA